MSKSRQDELIEQLAVIAEELGWLIALPSSEGDKVPGVILGNEDFIFEVAKGLNGGEGVEVYEKPNSADPEDVALDAYLVNTKKKPGGGEDDPTFH